MQSTKEHWEQVYDGRLNCSFSWYQEHARQSRQLIGNTGISFDAPVIDVGGGASTLVDDLLACGYSNLTLLDISSSALAATKERLGATGKPVRWIQSDITEARLEEYGYEVWHDRAVFHFLASPGARQKYINTLSKAIRPGGHIILSTFALDGPCRCSGLPAVRYSPETLHAELGDSFDLVTHEKELHLTPSGVVQSFIYCHFRKCDS
ncbi:MAG: class I SAM-dependent methyltransferase [Chlorobiaceae bacterium]|nr:class I SAM-dependent methyltransferase [Chlorobiaceae bacterium]